MRYTTQTARERLATLRIVGGSHAVISSLRRTCSGSSSGRIGRKQLSGNGRSLTCTTLPKNSRIAGRVRPDADDIIQAGASTITIPSGIAKRPIGTKRTTCTIAPKSPGVSARTTIAKSPGLQFSFTLTPLKNVPTRNTPGRHQSSALRRTRRRIWQSAQCVLQHRCPHMPLTGGRSR